MLFRQEDIATVLIKDKTKQRARMFRISLRLKSFGGLVPDRRL
jgi:hypothetical protein